MGTDTVLLSVSYDRQILIESFLFSQSLTFFPEEANYKQTNDVQQRERKMTECLPIPR